MRGAAPKFYEFFAGAGMARAGLGSGWRCVFANELDPKKSQTYRENWGEPDALKVADVRFLVPSDLRESADLAWASFPCQDLSLAGAYAGLEGDRSGTFWPFWRLMERLLQDGRAPALIVLENVVGTLTSHGGADFAAISDAFRRMGYRFGPMVVDAVRFVPQSRPRLFIVGIREDLADAADGLMSQAPCEPWHTKALVNMFGRLPGNAKRNWVWWSLPTPAPRAKDLVDILEHDPGSVGWHRQEETRRLLGMMSEINRRKVAQAIELDRLVAGAVYKRTRKDGSGTKIQRAEVRFDGVSGCLRTPAGGSSRQLVLIINGRSVRSRLMSPRETARLMGLPESYQLPARANEAYHLTGDGVVVPVVRHLAHHLFEPIIRRASDGGRVAA